MKKFLLPLLAAASLFTAAPASAVVLTTLELNFASGALFTGQLTFSDNFEALLGVDGTLSGAAYGNVHVGQTWLAATEQGAWADLDENHDSREDWLLGGVGNSDAYAIGLSWLPNQQNLTLLLSPQAAVYHAGIDDSDAIVGADASSIVVAVPEPGSVALLGLGLLAMGALRRRRA